MSKPDKPKGEAEQREEQRRSLVDELGFVTYEDVRNAHQEWLIDLDQSVWPEGERHPSRRHVVEWAENYLQRLLKRARHNLAQHLELNPQLKAQLRQERDQEAMDKSKKNWEERRRLGAQYSGGG